MMVESEITEHIKKEAAKDEPDESMFSTTGSEIFSEVDMERTTINRIKVYVHNSSKHIWEDIGTGHVGCLTKEPEHQHYIHFRWEDGEFKSSNWKITEGMSFTKQQDTLVLFIPIDDQNETALSFQSKEGADIFWKNLCERIGRNPDDINIEEEESVNSSDDEGLCSIPPLKIVTLPEIENVCAIAQKSLVMKERLADTIQKNNWLGELKNIYDITSDLEDTFSLVLISRITKNLIMLNRDDVVQFLFDNSNLQSVLQLLSYIPNEVPTDHVDFLYNKAKWQQVFRIQNKDTIGLIERAFRVQYLVDVCLPPRLSAAIAVEDSWPEAAENYLNMLRNQILTNILAEEHFENDVIAALSSSNTNIYQRRNLIKFLHELVKMADCFVVPAPKKRVFETLFNMDIIRIVKPCVVSDDYVTRITTMDLLLQISRFDVKEVLEFINDDSLSHSATESFILTEIVNLIKYDPDPEVNLGTMVTQFLRHLIGPEDQPLDYPVQRQHFVGIFFKKSFRSLLQPVLQGVIDERLSDDSYCSSRKIALVIFFLAYCVRRHPVAARGHLISTGVLTSVAVLMSSKHSFLFMSAFKLIKTVIMAKDDFLIRHMMSANVLSTVVSTFFDKYVYCNNMYNSAYLDFFDYIAKNDYKEILKHIMEKFGDKFEDLTYCTSFDLLRSRFRQLHYNADLCNPDTPESLPEKDAEFSDTDENITIPGASLVVKDADFRPRLNVVRVEEEGFSSSGQLRPPTPITKRIIMKILRRPAVEQTLEPSSVPSCSALSYADGLEPLKLVDYDDSDQESSDKEESIDTTATKETNETALEQRGRKRKASLEDEDDSDSVSQPKRITANNTVNGL